MNHEKSEHGAGVPPRDGRFLTSLALLALVFVAAATLGWRTVAEFRETRSTIDALEEAAEEIRYCDEVLTMSANMAVFTGLARWADRYHAFVPRLRQALDVATREFPRTREALARLSVANERLLERERSAMALSAEGRRAEAAALMSGAQYAADKAAYAGGLGELTGAMDDFRTQVEAGLRRDVAAAGVALAVLFLATVFLLWRAYRVLAERIALESALGEVARGLASRPTAAIDDAMRAALSTIETRSGAARVDFARRAGVAGGGVRRWTSRPGDGADRPASLSIRIARPGEADYALTIAAGSGGLAWSETGDGDVLRALGEMLVRAVEVADRESALTRLATTDSLTGLANRRSFAERLVQESMRTGRTGRPAALLMFDIDHFKAVNDRHGHAVGDAVLARIAEVARETMRATDLVGRIGGEEFAVLMQDTDLETGVAAAERLRRAVAAASVDTPGGPVAVTVSLGVTALGGARDGTDAAFGRADQALYAAKAAGRDCVRAASPID